jgi:hypothetical protein
VTGRPRPPKGEGRPRDGAGREWATPVKLGNLVLLRFQLPATIRSPRWSGSNLDILHEMEETHA